MSTSRGRIGILVGGGPAPGINSVISAATIEAINRGYEVVGIIDGFSGLMNGGPEKFRNLYISDVSRIHNQGGSILRTSRANPTASEDGAARCFANLQAQGISALISASAATTRRSARTPSRGRQAARCARCTSRRPSTTTCRCPPTTPPLGMKRRGTLARKSS